MTLPFSRFFPTRASNRRGAKEENESRAPCLPARRGSAARSVVKTRQFFGPRALRICPYSSPAATRQQRASAAGVGGAAPATAAAARNSDGRARVFLYPRCAASFRAVGRGRVPGDGTGAQDGGSRTAERTRSRAVNRARVACRRRQPREMDRRDRRSPTFAALIS